MIVDRYLQDLIANQPANLDTALQESEACRDAAFQTARAAGHNFEASCLIAIDQSDLVLHVALNR